MKILVINSGSSSIKSTLFEFKKHPEIVAKAHIDGIGLKRCKLSFTFNKINIGHQTSVNNHENGVKLILQTLLKTKAIKNYKEIEAVGHRVVHGGEKYTNSVRIDSKILKAIEKLSELAPLHNPANIASIKACKTLLPKAKQVAVFDTAFHQTMPPHAYLYGLPLEYYEKHQIRRYGFHGTSHKYVVAQTIKALKTKKAKIISCHLGNGSSITASVNGKSIDTSMGFTPLEGVIMGTRSGSIDPAIIFHLEEQLKMKPHQVNKILNNESGLKGISGISSDMRDIYHQSLKGNKRAALAIDILAYQIAKYCGAYAAAMQGLTAIAFTGGIGEKAFYVRAKVCDYLEFLKLKLDKKKNENCKDVSTPVEISDRHSKIKIFVIKTDEEIQIANETKALL